jgi:hypothetical protein
MRIEKVIGNQVINFQFSVIVNGKGDDYEVLKVLSDGFLIARQGIYIHRE